MIDWTAAIDEKTGRALFTKSEWPGDVTEDMAPELFDELFKLRKRAGCSMRPSPLVSAHVRASGNSRHSTQGWTRKSDATDIFLNKWDDAFRVFMHALAMGFGGIGLYVDTAYDGPRPMIHLDMRPNRVVWVRQQKSDYVYYHKEPKRLFEVLSRVK
jgi:uncharacterized protein YcbK (DUF882 family)